MGRRLFLQLSDSFQRMSHLCPVGQHIQQIQRNRKKKCRALCPEDIMTQRCPCFDKQIPATNPASPPPIIIVSNFILLFLFLRHFQTAHTFINPGCILTFPQSIPPGDRRHPLPSLIQERSQISSFARLVQYLCILLINPAARHAQSSP